MKYTHCLILRGLSLTCLVLISTSCISGKTSHAYVDASSRNGTGSMSPYADQVATCIIPLNDVIKTAFHIDRTTSDADLVAALRSVWPEVPLEGTDIALLHETGEIIVSGDRLNTYITKAFINLPKSMKEFHPRPLPYTPSDDGQRYHFLRHLNSIAISEVEFDNIPFDEAISNLSAMANCDFVDCANELLDQETMDGIQEAIDFYETRHPDVAKQLRQQRDGRISMSAHDLSLLCALRFAFEIQNKNFAFQCGDCLERSKVVILPWPNVSSELVQMKLPFDREELKRLKPFHTGDDLLFALQDFSGMPPDVTLEIDADNGHVVINGGESEIFSACVLIKWMLGCMRPSENSAREL